jgi:hypothetical protein
VVVRLIIDQAPRRGISHRAPPHRFNRYGIGHRGIATETFNDRAG